MSDADRPSAIARIMAWLVVFLSVGLLVLGFSWYGFSTETHQRFWNNIFGRVDGPMSLRFLLQPTMALIAALPDGIRDARYGHSAFFWTVWRDPTQHGGRLREGLIAVARIVLIGISIDTVYQLKVFDRFYPVEALTITILLALVPYFVFRWIVELVARWWLARKDSGSPA
jgi:hypothetical protein